MHSEKQIDRYLADGLGGAEETALRTHLRGCAECLAYYDRQVALYRALAGDSTRPSPSELARLERLALTGAGLAPHEPDAREGLVARLAALVIWNPRPAFAAAAALLLVAGAALLMSRPPPAVPSATLVAARDVTVAGARAAEKQILLSGATVVVAEGGVAELSLERGGRVRVFPGTELSLEPRGSTVNLVRGRVWCDVERNGDGFRVRTADAEARVLGTSFVVEADPGKATEVRVVHGVVEVEDREGKGKVEVKAGQKSQVRAGQAPGPVRRYTPEEDTGMWDRLLRAIGRTIETVVRKAGEIIGDAVK